MINYIKSHPVNVALSILFVLAFGVTTFFLISSNSDLRQENREMKQQNKDLAKANEVLLSTNVQLQSDIEKRNEVIEKSTVVYDSLQKKLIQLNDKRIVTNFPNHNTISTLDLDEQILLLSTYINTADSIGR